MSDHLIYVMATNVLVRFLDRTKMIACIRGKVKALKIALEASTTITTCDVDDRALSINDDLHDVIPYLDALSKVGGDIVDQDQDDDERSFREEVFKVISDLEDIVLPLLLKADGRLNDGNDCGAFRASCDLLMCALTLDCEHGDDRYSVITLRLLKSVVSEFCLKTSVLMDNAVELLCRVFAFLRRHSKKSNCGCRRLLDKETMTTIRQFLLSECLDCGRCSARTCVRIAVELLPYLTTDDTENSTAQLASGVWNVIMCSFEFRASTAENLNDNVDIRESNANGFLLLGCTADLLFSVVTGCGAISNDASAFWKIIQCGLTNSDSLRRKQSLYLLKRVFDCDDHQASLSCDLFVWTSAASDRVRNSFDDIMFVLDTLEEKQVHIVKPTFPVVRRLIDATIKRDDEDGWSLHTSWIVVVLRRMLVHDSKTIKLWLIEEICSLDLNLVPIFEQGMHKFLHYHFLVSLNDSSIFSGIGRIQEFAFTDLLVSHLNHCLDSLKTDGARANYFRAFLHNMRSQGSWSAVPLFHVAKALSVLPMRPLWNRDSMNDLRELVVNTVRTHDTVIRIATEELLLIAFLNFADQTELSLDELASILAIFKELSRGTPLWIRVVNWIKEAEFAQHELAVQFLADCTRDLLHLQPDRPLRLEMRAIARIAVLLADAHEEDRAGIAIIDLEPYVDILHTAHSHPYMSTSKPEAAMKFLLAIVTEVTSSARPNSDCKFERNMRSSIARCADEFMHYFRRIVFQGSNQVSDYGSLEIHFKFVRFLMENDEFLVRIDLGSHMKILAQISLSFLDQLDQVGSYMKRIVIVKCLALVCRSLSIYKPDGLFRVVADLMAALMTGDRLCSAPSIREPVIFAEWTHEKNPNQIASDYVQCVWSCVLRLLNHSDSNANADTILAKGVEALQIGGVKSLAIIFKCFELLLPKVLQRRAEFVADVLNSCWTALMENKPGVPFCNAVTALVSMAFQADLMMDDRIEQCLSNYGRLIYEQSKTYHGMYLPLVVRVVSVCKKSEAEKPRSALQNIHVQVLIQGLLFGHIHRKDHRVVKDTEAYIVSLGQSLTANSLTQSDYLHDKMVRVHSALSLITVYNVERSSLFAELVHGLIDRDEAATIESKRRHYANSMTHRVKQRIWQSLLILEPVYSKEMAHQVLTKIVAVLIEENLQPSVRYLMEWLAVRICLRFPEFWHHLWTAMDKASNTRVGSLVSFISIVCHVGCASARLCDLQKEDNNSGHRVEFISKAIASIMPWTSAQHFSTRIYAQVTLNKLWQLCKTCDSPELAKLIETFRPLESFFRVSTEQRVSARNVHKLSDYFFEVFDLEKHFTVETVFYELPRLCNFLEDEWLEIKLFCDVLGSDNEPCLTVPLSNENRSLAELRTGSWLIRSSSGDTCEEDTTMAAVESDVSASGDLQRKLTPWKQEILSNYEAICAASGSSVYGHKRESQMVQSVHDDHPDDERLVVVASLIDKATNLGGLCRTCEVFGASRYVIGSERYVEDKLFQSLSVSSEKWVPIEEVKAHNLKDYLLSMKAAGYTVVGVEQTANSHKLSEFKFPKKTVLVLGKEKEGIPVEIIQLMDVCVEIPQQGVVRSLNVHVTGAIAIWEYRRQRSLFLQSLSEDRAS